jgi:hypothetical protein
MRPIGVVIASVLLAACGGVPVPNAQRTEARASIRGAEEVGAEEHPQAALHLKMAKDQVTRAERYIADDENLLARRALERATLDAELALQLSRTAVVSSEAAAALKRVEELNHEAAR